MQYVAQSPMLSYPVTHMHSPHIPLFPFTAQ